MLLRPLLQRIPSLQTLRRLAAVLLVMTATLGGAISALAIFRVDRELGVAGIELSTQPGHDGALDIYVPLVDWGLRFDAVRLPARLSVDVRTVDRDTARRVAAGQLPDLEMVREEARHAIAAYIRLLVLVVAAGGFVTGAAAALVIRGGRVPRLRWLLGTSGATALLAGALVATLLPPRGDLTAPEYYANGPDIPVALRELERATASARAISDELDDQLIGLARLISASAEREPLDSLPRLTLASDLHNNLLAFPTLERAARGGPLLFAGDLTASGTPFEAATVRRAVDMGDPFVFVSGNHDSDVLVRRLAEAGAIVLTERGRLRADGSFGEPIVRVDGLRIAGYSDPFERERERGFRALREPKPTERQKQAFADWLRPLVGRVDVVLVHSPSLAATTVEELREQPPREPLAILTGHTHEPFLRESKGLLELNGGTVGGGGVGNFQEDQPFGVAILTFETKGGFRPVAADLVRIDVHDGSARAERHRLDRVIRGEREPR